MPRSKVKPLKRIAVVGGPLLQTVPSNNPGRKSPPLLEKANQVYVYNATGTDTKMGYIAGGPSRASE